MTPAKKNDRSQLDALADETGCTYVYDRGYMDYAKFDDYCERGIFFVTRTKRNTVIRPVESLKLPEDAGVLTDEVVYVGTPQKRIENVLRLIYTMDSEGDPVAILTNRFDLDADEIGQIYRERWALWDSAARRFAQIHDKPSRTSAGRNLLYRLQAGKAYSVQPLCNAWKYPSCVRLAGSKNVRVAAIVGCHLRRSTDLCSTGLPIAASAAKAFSPERVKVVAINGTR